MNYTITNIVATSKTTACSLDQLAKKFACRSVHLTKSDKFPAIFLRLNNGTCTIFGTGTITYNGCRTVKQLDALHYEYTQLSESRPITPPKIVNVVVKFTSNRKINLESIARNASAVYEPELSNTLEVLVDSGVKALIHSTGNGFVTGIKSTTAVDDVIRKIREIIFP